jgi:hypothetical protein
MERLASAVIIATLAIALNSGVSGPAWAGDLPGGLGFAGPAAVSTATSAPLELTELGFAVKSAMTDGVVEQPGAIGSAEAATLGAANRS